MLTKRHLWFRGSIPNNLVTGKFSPISLHLKLTTEIKEKEVSLSLFAGKVNYRSWKEAHGELEVIREEVWSSKVGPRI